MTFPEIGISHAPENWNYRKISGWVFQDLPIRVELDILSKTWKSHIYRDAEQNRSKVRSLLPRPTVLKKYTNEVLSVEYLDVYNKRSKFIHVTSASPFSYVSPSKNISISQMQCYHGATNGAIFTMKIIKKKKHRNCTRESGTFSNWCSTSHWSMLYRIWLSIESAI